MSDENGEGQVLWGYTVRLSSIEDGVVEKSALVFRVVCGSPPYGAEEKSEG
ncbi:hypothetical protein [Streptosporangium canum]|uniref:hypothetical protein n=1 Tax=Streptosporangium canum TaxID=324952 RepID=UPI0037B6E8BD